jgi:hypothetical protein
MCSTDQFTPDVARAAAQIVIDAMAVPAFRQLRLLLGGLGRALDEMSVFQVGLLS